VCEPGATALPMQLFGPAVEKLLQKGVTGKLLNAHKFRPKLRLWGASPS
jgi:hypothetical protein